MAWVKWSDTANSHRCFMKLAEVAAESGDARLETEVKGAVFSLAQWSAQTWSDYVIPWGVAIKILGMGRARPLVDVMVDVGLLIDCSTEEEKVYKLIEDEQGLFHIIKRSDKLMGAKRKRDRNRGALVVPVLLRDGAACRYTGEPVNFKSTNSDDGGTFDHRAPDEETTPDNYVVASRGANIARGEVPDPDRQLPLMDPPDSPVYDDWILEKLATWPSITARVAKQMGIPNPLETPKSSVEAPAEPGPARRTAPAEPAASRRTATTTQPTSPTDPSGSQPSRDPRSSAPPARESSANKDKGHQARSLPTSKAETPAPSTPVLRAPAGNQPPGEPRPATAESSPSDRGGNKQPRRRRRSRRRR